MEELAVSMATPPTGVASEERLVDWPFPLPPLQWRSLWLWKTHIFYALPQSSKKKECKLSIQISIHFMQPNLSPGFFMSQKQQTFRMELMWTMEEEHEPLLPPSLAGRPTSTSAWTRASASSPAPSPSPPWAVWVPWGCNTLYLASCSILS